VGDEQGGEGHGAVLSFEAAGGTDMVFEVRLRRSMRCPPDTRRVFLSSADQA